MAVRSVIRRGRQLFYSLPWVVGARSINYAQTVPRSLSLITASSGISKGHAFPQLNNTNLAAKWSFGDDAYFVAKCLRADVIGELRRWLYGFCQIRFCEWIIQYPLTFIVFPAYCHWFIVYFRSSRWRWRMERIRYRSVSVSPDTDVHLRTSGKRRVVWTTKTKRYYQQRLWRNSRI